MIRRLLFLGIATSTLCVNTVQADFSGALKAAEEAAANAKMVCCTDNHNYEWMRFSDCEYAGSGWGALSSSVSKSDCNTAAFNQ